ncbi:MAG TPA: hypothetical protein VIJ36_19255, partial [Thermoanaerobaculia bacterium]
LTNRQVVVAFVILLICVLGAFFSGVWIGRESTARLAQEQLVRNAPPAQQASQEGRSLDELEFFDSRNKKGEKKAAAAPPAAELDPAEARRRQQRQKELRKKLDLVTSQVENSESRVHAINEMFCDPTFFDRTPREQVKRLENEQKTLSAKVEELMGEWERIETEMAELGG